MTTTITVGRDGTLRMIYDDAHAPLLAHGAASVRRASHVEPHADGRGWYADLGPVGGPVLDGFATRQAALDAERGWLEAHVL